MHCGGSRENKKITPCLKVSFLSDPGVPGVRSMGPVVSHSQTERPCADLTDGTLDDEYTNTILTDNVNRAFQAMWQCK